MALIDWLLGRDTEDRALEGLDIATVTLAPGVTVPITELGAGYGIAGRLPAAYRARLSTINTVGQLPVNQGKPLPALVRRPDPSITRQEWVRQSVAALVDHGNLFWRLVPGGRTGTFAALQVCDYNDVTVTWDRARLNRVYQWRNRPMVHGRDIWHVAMGRGAGELLGHGPMQHRRMQGVALMLAYSEDFYAHGGPKGALTHPAELSGPEAERMLDLWEELHPAGSRRPGMLSGGLGWNSDIGANMNDAEWVAAHGAGILDVAQIFGMPARLLGYSQPGSSLTYGNVTDVYLSWWREGLQPDYVSPLEEAWAEVADAPVAFDPLPLLRGNLADRLAAYAVGINAGVYTEDEARAMEGLPPRPDTGSSGNGTPDDERETADV